MTTDAKNTLQNKDAEELLNYYITLSEVEAVILHLKRNESPGPDEVDTEKLQNAGEEFDESYAQINSNVLAYFDIAVILLTS